MQINQVPTEKVEKANSEDELLRVENEYWAEMAKDLAWLRTTPQFKRVILDGYFKDKAINGVSLLATDHVKRGGFRGDIMEQLVAISHLEDYLIMIENLGSAPVDDDEVESEG